MSVAAEGLTLGDICTRLGGTVRGDPNTRILRVAPIEDAGPGAIAFLANQKYRSRLAETRAAAVILAEAGSADCPVPAIVHANPYLYFARVSALLNPPEPVVPGVHPSAVIEDGTSVAATASIGPQAVVGRGARIGERVSVGPGCVLGPGVQVGDDSRLYPRVVVYADCVIGARVILHAGVVIGSDGFGIARDGERWVKIPQVGRVLIGDDVEIGANTTVDRGAMGDTVIEEGVKLDNQIQVGHNVRIGAHTAMAGCVGIAGSARIGRGCTVGGAAVILGHLEIADGANISAGTLVSHSIRKAGTWSGPFPVDEHSAWLRNAAQLRRLGQLADRVRELERIVAQLKRD